jgi:hypothetical protein
MMRERDHHGRRHHPRGPARSDHRNHETAPIYDRLGLAEYEAIEGFVGRSPAWQKVHA